jgi:hypothetical protein
MTNTYNVHIYREMRLVFGGIEADTPEAAASIARDKPTGEADSIDDCEGETLSALVDVQGDEDYEDSRFIDFDKERLRKAAGVMLNALQMASNYLGDDLDESDETELRVFRSIRAAIAEAEATSPPPASAAAAPGQPTRFEIENDPSENSDRVYVMVDGKFDVAIIRTDEGVVVDVYPKDGFETVATTYAFDSDVEQESSTTEKGSSL